MKKKIKINENCFMVKCDDNHYIILSPVTFEYLTIDKDSIKLFELIMQGNNEEVIIRKFMKLTEYEHSDIMDMLSFFKDQGIILEV